MKVSFPFRPKLADTLKGYSSDAFMADLVAGVTVGIVAAVESVMETEAAG